MTKVLEKAIQDVDKCCVKEDISILGKDRVLPVSKDAVSAFKATPYNLGAAGIFWKK